MFLQELYWELGASVNYRNGFGNTELNLAAG